MHTEMIIRICDQLVKAGKKPSIGLVRAKLEPKVSLATIIKGIGLFESNRLLGVSEAEQTPENNNNQDMAPDNTNNQTCLICKNNENRILLLETQIQNMQQALINLQAQVKGLNAS